jgi:hypothetical protein
MQVIFPRDTADSWGWSERTDPNYQPSYRWLVLVDGMDGMQSINLGLSREEPRAREFESLDALVAAARPTFCSGGGMLSRCVDGSVFVSVVDRHVTISFRDSAAIGRMFGLRQKMVTVLHGRPEAPMDYNGNSIEIEYAEPQIPAPTDSMRADAARSRRAFQASINTVHRSIVGGRRELEVLWMTVGDSIVQSVQEFRCQYDTCFNPSFAGDGNWTVVDTTVVRLHPPQADTMSFEQTTRTMVVARRVGRTTLRVDLSATPSDTLPSSTPPARTLTREIRVAPRIARIALQPEQRTANVDDAVYIRVRAYDKSGRRIRGAPVQVTATPDKSVAFADSTGDALFTFPTAGTRTFVARAGAVADSVTVNIVSKKSP